MGAHAFGLWLAFMELEGLSDAPGHRAELLASLHNGPLMRNDKRLWSKADFMPAPITPEAPAAAPPTSLAEIREAARRAGMEM